MLKNAEINELCKVYEEMDVVGKKEMFEMSKKFYDVQKIIDDERVPKDKNEVVKSAD